MVVPWLVSLLVFWLDSIFTATWLSFVFITILISILSTILIFLSIICLLLSVFCSCLWFGRHQRGSNFLLFLLPGISPIIRGWSEGHICGWLTKPWAALGLKWDISQRFLILSVHQVFGINRKDDSGVRSWLRERKFIFFLKVFPSSLEKDHLGQIKFLNLACHFDFIRLQREQKNLNFCILW